MTPKIQKNLQIGLVCLGFLQMVGFVIQVPAVKGIAAATTASPLPLVFSNFRGFDTFAAIFDVKIQTVDGQIVEKELSPKVYSAFGGPYNRRNVYGAVFAYGPKFETEKEIALRDSVLRYGFCNHGPLANHLEVPSAAKTVQIKVTGTGEGEKGPWTFGIECI